MINRPALRALLTLPVLTLASASACAQSNVSISGFLDIGVFRGFDKVKNVGTIQRSNLAFGGSEDLGDGLAATFKLSHRLDLDTGTTEAAGKPFWQGESTVGLKGGFGAVRLGRALDVIYANDWAYDPWGNFNRIASPAWQLWHYNYASDRTSNTGGAEYGRLANGVFYDSPSFGGFAAHLSGAFENSNTAPGSGTGNNLGASLNYDKGPVSAMLAHSKNSSGDRVTFVGGKYTVGSLDLMGAYDVSTFAAAVESKAKVITLGAIYSFGLTSLKLGLGRLDLDGAKTNFAGLGADYLLSKRTTLYVSAGRKDPKGASATSAYGAGVSHMF